MQIHWRVSTFHKRGDLPFFRMQPWGPRDPYEIPISSRDSYESSIGRGIPLLGVPEISLQCISRFHRPTPPPHIPAASWHKPQRRSTTFDSAEKRPQLQRKYYSTNHPEMVLKPVVNTGTNLPTSTRDLIRDFWTINSSNTRMNRVSPSLRELPFVGTVSPSIWSNYNISPTQISLK